MSIIHYIRYHNWAWANGLKLPTALQWFSSENELPSTPVNNVEFTDIILSTAGKDKLFYKMPKAALIGVK